MRPLRNVVAALTLLVLAGCAQSMAMQRDERVRITGPRELESVTLPFDLTWRSRVPRGADGPYFAVFVDRPPVRPGGSLLELADRGCRRTPACPDAAYLEQRWVFLTDDTSLRFDILPGAGEEEERRTPYEVTIVLVDERGVRIGESAWRTRFHLREAQS